MPPPHLPTTGQGRPALRRAFTLIEMLVVVSIILLLAGILIPVIGLVRERSRTAEAGQTVAQLVTAFEQYASEDTHKRFPYPGPFADDSNPYSPTAITYHRSPEASEPATAWSIAMADRRGGNAIVGVLGLLEAGGMPMPTLRLDNSDEDRRLLDPWRRPYRFRLGLPGSVRDAFTCTHGKSGLPLHDWNWNATSSREAKRNGQDPTLARPFPYIYSWGKSGSSTDPCTWIYLADTR